MADQIFLQSIHEIRSTMTIRTAEYELKYQARILYQSAVLPLML